MLSRGGIHHVVNMVMDRMGRLEDRKQVERPFRPQATSLSIKAQPEDGLEEGYSADSCTSPGCPDAQPQSPGKQQKGSTDEQVELSRVSGSSSAASGSGFSRSQHFNPDQDAILRLECLSGRRLKVGWVSGEQISCSLSGSCKKQQATCCDGLTTTVHPNPSRLSATKSRLISDSCQELQVHRTIAMYHLSACRTAGHPLAQCEIAAWWEAPA